MRTNDATDRGNAQDGVLGHGGHEQCRPADVRSAVRQAVSGRCGTSGCPYDEDGLSDALLVASELTSNAILHGGGITGFDVDMDGPAVRVSVSDRSDRLPVTHDPLDEQGRQRTGGRGWPIVCRLARNVKVACLPSGGKRITAVVPVF
ncbi:anti-sigma regulatory factor (Ser/Thr protein kinase) [Streptomyces sp. 3330]|uniref:ATP-binding protein n=1 Tax=Streptomyces sp. 3330 TaxID=2817755 RepID=UPI00285D4F36|nr:ATP-binding protein [Streptomyces sp. 3330]MDR6978904.1 anti-sigma regulatory factor (Ser/Thr protein kinase) [Streptomyces sp. 3330]